MVLANLNILYEKYPEVGDCIERLELIRWQGEPICPYCGSSKYTPLLNERRYHCGLCNVNFSVTVDTLFHKTHVDLRKWFLAIAIVMESRKLPSARRLAQIVQVDKNTAYLMLKRLKNKAAKDFNMLLKIRDEVMNNGERH